MPLLFVYGTLKSDQNKNYLLKSLNGKFLGQFATPPVYDFMDLGYYPAAMKGGNISILGEVWEVDNMSAVDMYEGVPGLYTRDIINTDYGEAYMYFLTDIRSHEYAVEIPDGVWEGY